MTDTPIQEGPPLVHGSCVAIEGQGVLLRGESGTGKSDLALRLIDQGAALVGDDYLYLEARDGAVWAAAPDRIAGLIELRGVGVIVLPRLARVALRLVIDLLPAAQIQRLPEPRTARLLDISLPCFALPAFEASTPAKIRAILRAQREGAFRFELSPGVSEK